MSDLLIDIAGVWDSREKSTKRIEVFKEYIESNGGAVERGALPLCDYKIEGVFRDKEISLGIEFKTLNDFSGSYQDLPDKLARSFELYTDVGLFVEVPTFKVSSIDEFHATIVNPAVSDGTANVLQYASMLNALASWQQEGVHVRQIGSEAFFGYAIGSVLINITKDTHRGLEISKTKDFKSSYLNSLAKLDKVGYLTAQKIAKYFPNYHWLASHCEEDLKDKLGKVTGSRLHTFLHCHDLETDEWRNGFQGEQVTAELPIQPPIPIPPLILPESSKPPVKSEKKVTKSSKEGKNKSLSMELSPPQEKTQPASKLSASKKNIDTSYLDEVKSSYINITEESQKWYPAILAYIQGKPKGIEVSSIIREIPACPEQVIFKLISDFMKEGEAYEPKVGTILATTIKIPDEKVSDIFETAPIVERDLQPSIKDVIEFIRVKPRKIEDVGKEFGFTNEYTLKVLYKLKEDRKIWLEKSSMLWTIGHDKNPMPIVADKEMDIGLS